MLQNVWDRLKFDWRTKMVVTIVGLLATILWTSAASAQQAPPSVTITGTTTLNWEAPTQNVDGTPLTDLGGYRVYFGSASRAYEMPVDIGLAGSTSTQFTIPLQSGTDGQTISLYFAMTAYDRNNPASGFQIGDANATPRVLGDNESAWSNEVLKQLTITVVDGMPPNPPVLESVELDLTCTTANPLLTCTITVLP